MTHPQFRRVARLEREVQAYLGQKEKSRSPLTEKIRRDSFTCVANLCVLMLFGYPKIHEPLGQAWQRCTVNDTWRLCRERHPHFGSYNRDDEGDPCQRLGAKWIAEYFEKYCFDYLPGADQTEKINRVLHTAPPWLLWGAFMDVHGPAVGITIPDISSMMRFARGEITFGHLPTGPFVARLLPPGTNDTFYNEPTPIVLPDDLTKRERARAIEIYKKLGRRVAEE